MDCGCSFTEKEFNKLRIFLSYGHNHNEELVRLIKTDLEKRGHDMWFDKNEIKFGHELWRSITDGILSSNRVLSFLLKHITRDLRTIGKNKLCILKNKKIKICPQIIEQ